MSRNRATTVASSTLVTLKKVKPSLQNSLHSNKFLTLLNNFCTVSAQREDFYNEPHLNSNTSQPQQYPIPPKPPTNGFYKQTPNFNGVQQNTSFGNNRVGQDRNFSNSNGGFYGDGGVSRDTPQIQHNGAVEQSFVGQDRSFSNGGFQNQNGFYGGGGGGGGSDLRGSAPVGYSSNSGIPNVRDQGRYLGVQGNQNGGYAAANGVGNQFQPNLYGDYREIGGRFQQNNTNAPYVSNVGFNTSGNQGQMCVNSDNESAEVAEDAGTVEELDDLCKENKVKEAVELLEALVKKGTIVDLPRYVLLMKACGDVGILQHAKSVHGHLMRSGGHIHVSIHNKILEMYTRCGSTSDAWEVFENIPERNLTSWDTMITGLAKNGLGEDAISLFTRFKEAGLRPDGQIFMGVFLACSVLCDVDEGMVHFESMQRVYGIAPSMELYVSVVNMLGNVGYLDEAKEFIEKMPVEPNVDVWETLMNMCRVHGNIELGNHCAEIVGFLDPSRLTDQAKKGLVPGKASDIGIEKKKLSNNLLEVSSKVHEFRAGDRSQPESDGLYALLRGMSAQMKEAGYVPITKVVLHDVDEESKEEAVLAHSEKLAVSRGLITSSARSSLRIIKNLRICLDCHNAMKLISEISGRELIIRDNKRFHHFKDGLCSCKEFW